MKQSEIPSRADKATVLAFLTWGLPAGESTWDLFSPELRARLSNAWSHWSARSTDRELAHDLLYTEHAGEVEPDLLRRVHVSWWVRALKEESPAVQRAVVRTIESRRLQATVAQGLNLDLGDLECDFGSPSRDFGEALDLWTERFVAGLPRPSDDPPVITILSALKLRRLYRIIQATGEIKRSVVHDEDSQNPADRRFLKVAEPDLAAHPGRDRRSTARLGLVTVGRLLTMVEPYRVRWALQHLPYTIANVIRAEIEWMNPLPSAWLRGERKVLDRAIEQAGGRS